MTKRRGFLSGLLEHMFALSIFLGGLTVLLVGIPLGKQAVGRASLRHQALDALNLQIATAAASASTYPNGSVLPFTGTFSGQVEVNAPTGDPAPVDGSAREIRGTVRWTYAGVEHQISNVVRVMDVTY